jgi:hypothetical protein
MLKGGEGLQLVKVRKLKSWLYEYEDQAEKEEHKRNMILAKFQVEKEEDLSVEYSQIIIESE